MNNLTITPKQELELISNGYTSLPQIKNESISFDDIDFLITNIVYEENIFFLTCEYTFSRILFFSNLFFIIHLYI